MELIRRENILTIAQSTPRTTNTTAMQKMATRILFDKGNTITPSSSDI
jgi:hypothetical protein